MLLCQTASANDNSACAQPRTFARNLRCEPVPLPSFVRLLMRATGDTCMEFVSQNERRGIGKSVRGLAIGAMGEVV